MFYARKFPYIQLFFRYFILQVTLVFTKCKMKCVCHTVILMKIDCHETTQTKPWKLMFSIVTPMYYGNHENCKLDEIPVHYPLWTCGQCITLKLLICALSLCIIYWKTCDLHIFNLHYLHNWIYRYDFLPNVQCEHVFHFCNLLYNLFFFSI